jgi:acyl-coenzyme A thioesterase PaaI-like protein
MCEYSERWLSGGVTQIAGDWSEVTVKMKRRLWNRNYVGTHFGGNLFAMTDPFWMLMALHRLGRGRGNS